jgi:UDP-N-acetylglucosamine transferase subunit ALG13
MIVVSVGTNEARFDRLLEWVSALGPGEELVVQHGPSPVRPAGAACVPYLSFDELADLVRRSRAFVTHAGVGSIMMSLSVERRPVVVPRLKRFGEAVDDHQVGLGRRLEAEGLVTLVEDEPALAAALSEDDHRAGTTSRGTALSRDLRDYLRLQCRPA